MTKPGTCTVCLAPNHDHTDARGQWRGCLFALRGERQVRAFCDDLDAPISLPTDLRNARPELVS